MSCKKRCLYQCPAGADGLARPAVELFVGRNEACSESHDGCELTSETFVQNKPRSKEYAATGAVIGIVGGMFGPIGLVAGIAIGAGAGWLMGRDPCP
jgi:hypothetical protein